MVKRPPLGKELLTRLIVCSLCIIFCCCNYLLLVLIVRIPGNCFLSIALMIDSQWNVIVQTDQSYFDNNLRPTVLEECLSQCVSAGPFVI